MRQMGPPPLAQIHGADAHYLPARLIAVAAVMMLGANISIAMGITTGLIAGLATAPLWLGVLSSFKGARFFMVSGVLALAAGAAMALLSGRNPSDLRSTVEFGAQIATLLVGVGLVLWVRTVLPVSAIGVAYGAAALAENLRGSPLFASNPWKFGFATGTTLIVLGLVSRAGANRWLAVLAPLTLAAVSALTDSRSAFGVLLMVTLLCAYQFRPARRTVRSSAAVALGLVLGAVIAVQVGQALILEGFLGSETQRRSEQQVRMAGSLITGGRPELSASWALFRDHPWGYGLGARPTFHDLQVAKSGLASIQLEPNSRYVEQYMFGNGFELHSVTADLWAWCGIAGLVFALVIAWALLNGLARSLLQRTAAPLVAFVVVRSLWDVPFSPFLSSLVMLSFAVGLLLAPTAPPTAVGELDRADDRDVDRTQ